MVLCVITFLKETAVTTKAYMVDPTTRIITLVDVGDYTDIQKQIGCSCFTVATQFANGDTLYVDDEGLLYEGNLSFNIRGGHQPFFGKGILMGSDNQGESIDVLTPMVNYGPDGELWPSI